MKLKYLTFVLPVLVIALMCFKLFYFGAGTVVVVTVLTLVVARKVNNALAFKLHCGFGGAIITTGLICLALERGNFLSALGIMGIPSIILILTHSATRAAFVQWLRHLHIPNPFGGRTVEDLAMQFMFWALLMVIYLILGFVLGTFLVLTLYFTSLYALLESGDEMGGFDLSALGAGLHARIKAVTSKKIGVHELASESATVESEQKDSLEWL